MKDANPSANTTKPNGMPKMEVPHAVREMAEQGTAQAKQAYDKMNTAATEASQVIQNACATSAQGAAVCNAKVIEFARANTNAAFDYVSELLAVKSPSDFVKLASEHARKQFEVLSAQTKELTALSQKVMTEAAEPLKAAADKMSRGPLA